MRARQLGLCFLGYAIYYFVRKNIPVAMPLLEKDLGISKKELGGFLTAGDGIYGVSKLANGFIGDRVSARWFMALGLALSALMNGLFGLASSAIVLGLIWLLNGWFQGMGFPPCARVLAHWFAPRERGRMWGIWNASHMVGGAAILVLAGWLGEHYGWRAIFLVPAGIALVVSAVLLLWLRDTPGSLGLPPVETYVGGAETGTVESQISPEAYRAILRERVFGNPVVWLASIGNFFVYTVRLGFFNWAPFFLAEEKDVALGMAGVMTAGYEICGLAGALTAGWLTDRFLGARRAPACALFMVATAATILWVRFLPTGNVPGAVVGLWGIGFFIYGPQFLVGVMVTDQAGKHAAAAAIGLTGIFGYASAVLTGYGMGWVLDEYGWDGGLAMLAGAALLGALPFALCWRARPVEEAVSETSGAR